MRDKLKALGIRLTELSNYLGYSRPTLYKYLEDYDNKKYKNIDYRVRKIFDFIMRKRTISKIEVINYIIVMNNESETQELDELIRKIYEDESFVSELLELISAKGLGVVLNIIKKAIEKGDVKHD